MTLRPKSPFSSRIREFTFCPLRSATEPTRPKSLFSSRLLALDTVIVAQREGVIEIDWQGGWAERKMNTDITASAKPEYPVLDRNPPFTSVVGNFSSLDYLRFVTITGVSVTVGYLSGPILFLSLSLLKSIAYVRNGTNFCLIFC